MPESGDDMKQGDNAWARRKGPWISLRVDSIGKHAVALAAVLLSISYAWFRAMTQEPPGDEGYLMITMRGFLDGHVLYDEIFTQYGPAYYLLRAPLYWWLDVPLGHDSTRMLSVLTWIATASLCALGVWRSVRSWLLSWFVFLQVIVHAAPITNEPGHPQELVALMLAAIFCVLISRPASRWGWGLAAVVLAVLTTVKINVGAFLALGLTAYWLVNAIQASAWARICAALSFSIIPFLLMRHHLQELWGAAYAVSAATAIGTVAAFTLTHGSRPIAEIRKEVAIVLLVASGVVALILGMALLSGVSIEALFRGLVLDPLRFPQQFSIPIRADSCAVWSSAASFLAAAIMSRAMKRAAFWRPFLAAIKFAYGVTGSVFLLAMPEAQLLNLAPWLWIAAMPLKERGDRAASVLGAPLLCALAAFQLLQAYPIAGSQLAWATLLLVPTYAFSLYDALKYACTYGSIARVAAASLAKFQANLPSKALLEALGLVVCIWGVSTIWMDLPTLRKRYLESVPLNLPGSRMHRTNLTQVSLYRSLAEYLRSNSDTFVAYQGFHNLHFWAEVPPPSQLNPALWELLTDQQQIAVTEALSRFARPRIVLTREALLAEWRSQNVESLRPLPRFIVTEYEPVEMIGPCVVLAPKPDSAND